MELRDIECFEEIAEQRHLGRAAERLGLSQPALSKSLRRLEEAMQVKLFDRNAKGLELTAEGSLLLARARDLQLSRQTVDRRTPYRSAREDLGCRRDRSRASKGRTRPQHQPHVPLASGGSLLRSALRRGVRGLRVKMPSAVQPIGSALRGVEQRALGAVGVGASDAAEAAPCV